MRSAGVPGVSLAMIRQGRLEETVAIGLRDTTMTDAVDPQTVFDAASLSKPVFTYALLPAFTSRQAHTSAIAASALPIFKKPSSALPRNRSKPP